MLGEIVTFAMHLMHLVGKKCLQLFNEITLPRFHLHVTIIIIVQCNNYDTQAKQVVTRKKRRKGKD